MTCKEASFRALYKCIRNHEFHSTAKHSQATPSFPSVPREANFYGTSSQAPQGSLRHPPSIHQTFPKPPNRPRVSLEHSRAFPKSPMPPSFPKAFPSHRPSLSNPPHASQTSSKRSERIKEGSSGLPDSHEPINSNDIYIYIIA